MDDLLPGRRRKKGWLDPRLGPEIRPADLQVLQQEGSNPGKIPGIIFKGVFLALAVALLPVLHKQSPQLMGYANHATIARSWELINLVIIGLAISYGLISRRPAEKSNDPDDLAVAAQGTQNYVQRMFEFAEVFDNFRTPANSASASVTDDKLEAWSSRWQPEEPLVVFAGDSKQNANDKRFGEKPILLPIRSLKSSLSNPDVFDFLKDGQIPSSTPAAAATAIQESGKPVEVRNGSILSVESGNFDDEVSNVIASDVFPSPIPWASRLDVLNNKESQPPTPAAANSPSTDIPAIPSPIPWRSRPEKGDVSECKPPLPPPQRPPPPPPELQKICVQKGASPSPSPSPPRPPPVGVANGNSHKNLQASSGIPLQKVPSPSPPRPRPPVVQNGPSQKHPNPKPQNGNDSALTTQNDSVQTTVKATPPAFAPSLPAPAENESSEKHHANGDISRLATTRNVVPNSDESKPSKASLPSPPAPCLPVFQDFPGPKKPLENGVTHRSDSRSKSRDDRIDPRSKSKDALSHSRRDIAEAELVPHVSRKFPSPPPPLPPAPVPDPLPPPPPPPLNPDVPTSTYTPPAPPPPPPCLKDQDHSHDELKHKKKTSSPSEVIFQVGGSESETETETEAESEPDLDALRHNSEEEVDKKADQFIARFHEQIRLQRIDSIRRSQERRERRGRK